MQSTLGDLLGSSWRTALESAPSDGMSSLATSWRADTAGVTEELPSLMLAEDTLDGDGYSSRADLMLPTLTCTHTDNERPESEIYWSKTGSPRNKNPDGSTSLAGIAAALRHLPTLIASDARMPGGSGPGLKRHRIPLHSALKLLPTLVAQDSHGHVQIRGQGPAATRPKSGTSLPGAMTLLPTLCATDYKSPYSADGYAKQTETRSKPLRDTAAHTIGIRLTEAFCLWWMGWPIEVLAATRALGSPRSATLGARCKSRLHTSGSEAL